MEDYVALLSMNYDDYCMYLLDKYGMVTDDYFSKPSYERFKKGEIKAPYKKKITRTSEGLYIHHIDEDKQILIADPKTILKFDIPFSYQEKERLVYCNLIEHAILHVLIAKKDYEEATIGNNFQARGIGGYIDFIRPELVQWLVKEVEPKASWKVNCRNAIAMPVSDAEKLINQIDNFLVENYPISQNKIENATVKWYQRNGMYG